MGKTIAAMLLLAAGALGGFTLSNIRKSQAIEPPATRLSEADASWQKLATSLEARIKPVSDEIGKHYDEDTAEKMKDLDQRRKEDPWDTRGYSGVSLDNVNLLAEPSLVPSLIGTEGEGIIGIQISYSETNVPASNLSKDAAHVNQHMIRLKYVDGIWVLRGIESTCYSDKDSIPRRFLYRTVERLPNYDWRTIELPQVDSAILKKLFAVENVKLK